MAVPHLPGARGGRGHGSVRPCAVHRLRGLCAAALSFLPQGLSGVALVSMMAPAGACQGLADVFLSEG
jgi:hypothetical protein